jgi:putative oxidoreductase
MDAMNVHETLALIARIVSGSAFFVLGIRNIANVGLITELIRARHIALPELSARVGVAMQIVFGGLLAFGPWPLVAAMALAIFVVIATWLAHWPFDKTGAERSENFTACLTNAILVGGLLANAALAT